MLSDHKFAWVCQWDDLAAEYFALEGELREAVRRYDARVQSQHIGPELSRQGSMGNSSSRQHLDRQFVPSQFPTTREPSTPGLSSSRFARPLSPGSAESPWFSGAPPRHTTQLSAVLSPPSRSHQTELTHRERFQSQVRVIAGRTSRPGGQAPWDAFVPTIPLRACTEYPMDIRNPSKRNDMRMRSRFHLGLYPDEDPWLCYGIFAVDGPRKCPYFDRPHLCRNQHQVKQEVLDWVVEHRDISPAQIRVLVDNYWSNTPTELRRPLRIPAPIRRPANTQDPANSPETGRRLVGERE
jgi:hypothetical protein